MLAATETGSSVVPVAPLSEGHKLQWARSGRVQRRGKMRRRGGVERSSGRLAGVVLVPAYTTVPNKTPTPAVIPIASAPQNVTRITLGMTPAPPARVQRTQKREEDQRSSRDKDNQGRLRGYGRNNERHHGSNGKATSRRECSLNRTRSESFQRCQARRGHVRLWRRGP